MLLNNSSGAVTIIDMDKVDESMKLPLSGWGSLFWINVQEVVWKVNSLRLIVHFQEKPTKAFEDDG